MNRTRFSLRWATLSEPGKAFIFGALLGVFLLLLQESTDVAMWDGRIYVAIAIDPWKAIFVDGLTVHSVQRVLPSIIVHALLSAIRAPLDESHILAAFRWLHVFELALCCYFFVKTTKRLGASNRASAASLLLLVCSFFTLKYVFLHPALTDMTAFLLATAMTYYFLAKQSWGVWVVGLLGTVTWPLVPYSAILLLLIPRCALEQAPPIVRKMVPSHGTLWLSAAAAIALAIPFVFPNVIDGFIRRFPSAVGFASVQYIPKLLPIAWLASFLYACYGLLFLWNGRELLSKRAWPWKLSLRQLAFVLTLAIGQRAVAGMGRSSGGGHSVAITDVLHFTFLFSFVKPAIFAAAHVGFFGVFWLLVATSWQRLCRELRACGVGMLLAVSMLLLLSLNSESRFMLGCYPLVTPFLARAMDERLQVMRWPWLLALAALIASKVYLSMTSIDPTGARQLSWLFAQNAGPWMSNKIWFAHIALTAALLLALWYAKWFENDRPGERACQPAGLSET